MRCIGERRSTRQYAALTPATLLALLLQANPAVAQTLEFQSGGAGLFIGYGGGKVMWGAEGFGTAQFDHQFCSTEPRRVAGPIGRLSFYGLGQPLLTLGAFGGAEPERFVGIAGEAGVTLALPTERNGAWDWTPHTGIWVEGLFANMFLHQEWTLARFPVGGGLRLMPAFGELQSCIVGRPQRAADGRTVSVSRRTTVANRVRGASFDREQLAQQWQRSAEEEFESVPAFLQLAAELRHAGAPEALIARALQAATDELRHTCLCTELAREFSETPWLPRVPRVVQRPALSGPAAIRRLAHESWLDGCLGEGLAAALARDSADTDDDPRVRRVESEIAVDEERHAELSWDVLTWCLTRDAGVMPLLERGGDPVLHPSPTVAGKESRRARIARDHRAATNARLATSC